MSPDAGTTDRYVDGRDITHFAAIVRTSVLGNGTGVTKLEIIAASDAAGTDLTVIKDSGALTLTTIAKWAMEECSMEEVKAIGDAAGVNLRYIAARITTNGSTDEATVIYFAIPVREYLNLTPATT